MTAIHEPNMAATRLFEGQSSPPRDSATGGSENSRNVRLAGYWGEVEDRQIFDKQFRHMTRGELFHAKFGNEGDLMKITQP